MKEKNVSLIMAILFLAAVIAAAGYAYFSADIELNGNIDAIISTAGTKPTFTSEVDGNINLTVNIENLTADNVGNTAAKSNSTINVSLLAGTGNNNVTCTYDIQFVWDGEPYSATTSLPTTIQSEPEAQGTVETKTYNFELSLQGSSTQSGSDMSEEDKNLKETNLDRLPWNSQSDKRVATVVNDATITNNSATNPTNVIWNFELKFYVLPTAQNQLLRKSFNGHLAVANVIC